MEKLTDARIRAFQPKAERYEIRAGQGFSLIVYPSGIKSFRLVFEFQGKKYRITLGSYPAMKLPQAQARHAEARRLLLEGRNPSEAWKAETAIKEASEQRELDRIKAEAEKRETEARRVTVGQWCERYITEYARPRKKTWTEDQRLLNKEVIPILGQRKLDEVKRADIVALLEGIKARLRAKAEAGEGRRDLNGTVANRVHAVLSKAFAYALEAGEVEHNPASGIRAAKVKEKSCERTLSDTELAWIWRTLSGDLAAVPFGRDAADLLQLMLCTGQRKAELLALRFDMIDDDGVARWGAACMKAGKAHQIPLPRLALEIVERRRAVALDPSGFVFPNARDLSKPMRGESANHAAYDWFDGRHEGGREIVRPPMQTWTPHDLRRTIATGLASMGVSRVVLNVLQAHADHSVSGTYDRHAYLPEMRTALEAWNRRIEALVSGDAGTKVLPLLRSACAARIARPS